MDAIHPAIQVPREAVTAFCRTWKISELALFGSAARGEMRPDSDIDVMVAFAPDAEWSLWDFAEMREQLKTLLGRDADVVERGTIRNPFRRRSIMRDLTILYAA
ncbi:MAG: nucleotidyltransferase family protein [Chloroflexi bacterium]|nr:nucleotidyltransferase family protein [Chloroflexota bacterium]